MKIGFLVGNPTQFEGPFFQYAARDPDHQVHVIYSDPDRLYQTFDQELNASISWGIDLLSGYTYSALPRRGRLSWLLRHIRDERYDLFIVNGYTRPEYPIASLASRVFSKTTALRLDSTLLETPSMRKRWLKRAMFAGFRGVYQHFFGVGALTRDYLRFFGVPPEHISLFPYVVDADYFRARSSLSQEQRGALRRRFGVPEGNTLILSVAKFNDREAPWDLLEAFCALRRPELSLLLVGEGEARHALEDYARRRPIGQVVFAGYMPYPDLPALYGAADLFVHPARREPWGVSVHEALACGLPVIASSAVGAGHDLIQAGANGFIYQAGRPDDLQFQLARLLDELCPERVYATNERLLAEWSHAATWRSILRAGSSSAGYPVPGRP